VLWIRFLTKLLNGKNKPFVKIGECIHVLREDRHRRHSNCKNGNHIVGFRPDFSQPPVFVLLVTVRLSQKKCTTFWIRHCGI
jgi:hypothetical protein